MSSRTTKVMREQQNEMQATFTNIRQKIADAQTQIRDLNNKAKRLDEEIQEPERRLDAAQARCSELRNKIADRERDLFDIENQIPLAKSKVHEFESLHGENTHFKKTLERTRKELEETTKLKEEANRTAKMKSEASWQAAQKLHKLEIDLQEVDHKLDLAMRRIVVARDKISVARAQTSSVSKNYEELDNSELESKLNNWLHKVDQAKARRVEVEEKQMRLSARVDELEHGIQVYQAKMYEMFSGQRELASSKIL